MSGQTPIKAAHINELRACLDAILANWLNTTGPVSSPPFQWRARSCPRQTQTDDMCSDWSNVISWTAASCARTQWRARSCPRQTQTDDMCSDWSNVISWTAASCARTHVEIWRKGY